MDEDIKRKAIELRHTLHMHPELAGQEVKTKGFLMDFLRRNTGLVIEDRGKWFFAKYTASDKERPPIAFRADMDAIKVMEDDSLPYASQNCGVSHKCGHDGHSSALCAFAVQTERKRADRDVYFIFQYAEETGLGAKECSELIGEEKIAEIYAVHNFPGRPEGRIYSKSGTVKLASLGLEYSFIGLPTHASTPELGRNPAKAISKFILSLEGAVELANAQGLLLVTLIQVDLGERAFGISAGRGKILLTARAEKESDLKNFIAILNDTAEEVCSAEDLKFELQYHDIFPETNNSREAIEKIKKACKDGGIEYVDLAEPIRTSEDFAYYLQKTKGTLVWMGAGQDCPPLHDKDFDYNDDLIERTCDFFDLLLRA